MDIFHNEKKNLKTKFSSKKKIKNIKSKYLLTTRRKLYNNKRFKKKTKRTIVRLIFFLAFLILFLFILLMIIIKHKKRKRKKLKIGVVGVWHEINVGNNLVKYSIFFGLFPNQKINFLNF